jgi:predicted TPR repeat methyltransferase
MGEDGFLAQSYVERTADETRQHYDDWAETYDEELTENAYATPVRSFAALQPLITNRDAEILDIGCGTGLFGRQLSNDGYSTIDGCDYSTGMLDKADQTGLYRQLFQANLNEPPLGIDDQPVASDAYDAAAAVGVFSFGHVEAAALDEIVRVVRPGGAIVIGLNDKYWNEGTLRDRLSALVDADAITLLDELSGAHLPGTGLAGQVITLRVN